jgi:hypothetical protein
MDGAVRDGAHIVDEEARRLEAHLEGDGHEVVAGGGRHIVRAEFVIRTVVALDECARRRRQLERSEPERA